MFRHRSQSRPGAVVPLTALTLVGLLGFVALALDLGMLMIARNQCQNAADAAAMAGARSLNGDTTNNNNYSSAVPNAKIAAGKNAILNETIDPNTQLTATIGDYYYDTASASFKINATGKQEGNNWTLCQATVTSQQPAYFARVFGFTSLNATATATAAHRPRDAMIVIDFSGSMRFDSMLGGPHSGSRTSPMNPDTIYPTWGHYNGNSSMLTYSADMTISSGEVIGRCNTSTGTSDAPTPVIDCFYADTTPFGTSVPAWTAASSSYATTPGGDQPLRNSKNSSTTFSKTVTDHVGTSGRDWRYELDGYAAYASGVANPSLATATDYSSTTFNGYMQGPGYWGKTFFTWPPDPRVPLSTTAPPGCSSGYYTATQIQNIVSQNLRDFGYTAADFNNTALLTNGMISSSSATTIKVLAGTSANFPATPFKVMVGLTNSSLSAFTTVQTPEVIEVTAVSPTITNGLKDWTVARGRDGTAALGTWASQQTNPNASFTTGATSIQVASNSGFPSPPFRVLVGPMTAGAFTSTPELMTVTAVSGTAPSTWTVTRNVGGTGAISGTTTMRVVSAPTIGLLTAPALYGTYTAASTTVSSTVGRTPASSQTWPSWVDQTSLGSYLTSEVYQPCSGGGAVLPATKLTSTSAIYYQLLRLYNRNGGPGMPTNGSGVAMPCDWRARFFKTPGGAPLLDNSRMWSAGGMLAPSSTTYLINYDAILDWIKNCGPNPFPNQLRAGGIVYYTSIPSTINVNTFPPPDPNQRIWKEYIDEVLGVRQDGGTGASPTYSIVISRAGYGDDFSWGTVSSSGVTSPPWPANALASYNATSPTCMNYSDNPKRPRLHYWFGPLTMVDFLGNYNASDPSNNNSPRLWWPGTATESPTYQTKLGIQAAIKDILTNHPNDNVGLIYFSSPKSSATGTGYYNYARVPFSRDARLLINSLWFSPKVITTNSEINVYNSSGVSTKEIYDVPRANGGTCYAMPLMIAYNQFSSNSSLLNYTANAIAGTAGGAGRNGANKLLVFETDGMVNTGASATFNTSTSGTGYYSIRIKDANDYSASGTEFPTGVNSVTFTTGSTQSQTIAQQICNNLSAGGFSTTRKPVKIHCIAFGSLFEGSSTSKTNALQNLASLEVIGKVQSAGATTLASNKIITGNFSTRINSLQTAFTGIMQDGVQVTLLSSGTGKP